MIATVHPCSIGGVVQVPTSKSAMQRALAASLLRRGKTILYRPGHSEDDHAALRCIRALGASVDCQPAQWTIQSNGPRPSGKELDCGESGLSIRLFTPLAALSNQPIRIIGSGSLVKRPMHFFEQVLPSLGVQIKLNQGGLPIELCGPLVPADIQVDGSLSSQFLTGLLMAYAGAQVSGVCIEVDDLKSRPYIDLTLDILERFGLPVPRNEGYQRFCFQRESVALKTELLEYTVEGDWSGASFWFAAAGTGAIELRGLDPTSKQADRAIEDLCRRVGMDISHEGERYQLQPGTHRPFEFDATDCPDLFPPLVALAAQIKGESCLYGTDRLAHKESDRARVLQNEFEKLGVRITLEGRAMRVTGGRGIKAGDVNACGDHRIAMALAVAALGAEGPVRIHQAESVRKSYPDFWTDLQSVGATVTLTE